MIPKVSVIVPVYNAEKSLERCIESIINQTLKEIEIILLNDGSTDRSKEIIEEYKKKDNRIVVINKDNSGPSDTRNYGIKIAKGQYIGFVDSDDYIEAEMYEKLISAVKNDSVQMSMCNYRERFLHENNSRITYHNLQCNRVQNKEYIREHIIRTFTGNQNYGFFALWNKIYLRKWLLDLGFLLDEKRDHGEDWWFNINAFMHLDSFTCIDDVLYNYVHINNNSLMMKYRQEQFDLFLDGRSKVLSTIPHELIDFETLNRNFVYEFSVYLLRTNKENIDKKRKKELIKKVLTNKEVIKCCKNVNGLPLHFKIITSLIKNRLYRLASLTYKILSFLI